MAKLTINNFTFKYPSPSGRNVSPLAMDLKCNQALLDLKSQGLFFSGKRDHCGIDASGSCYRQPPPNPGVTN